MKEKLFQLRLNNSANNKSDPWTEVKLKHVLRSLKNHKARDPWGLIYELFKPQWIGDKADDMYNFLLCLFNGMKTNLCIPKFLIYANITSIFKKRRKK